MSGPLNGVGNQVSQQGANPVEFFGKMQDLQSFAYFANYALDTGRSGSYNGPIPENMIQSIKDFLNNSSGPMVNNFLSKAGESIDQMEAADIRNYILDMGPEQFKVLYDNNAGVRAVIEDAAKEYMNTAPFSEALKTGGLDLTAVNFESTTDTCLLYTSPSPRDA